MRCGSWRRFRDPNRPLRREKPDEAAHAPRFRRPLLQRPGMTVMAAHQPTKALASFAADLDPAALPPEVRQKLGWLLLDYLRVCSIGARLPWSDWARKYIGLVGKEGASHVLFSASTLNPQ